MLVVQAILALVAILLLFLAAIGVKSTVSLALLGATFAVLAYFLPLLHTAL